MSQFGRSVRSLLAVFAVAGGLLPTLGQAQGIPVVDSSAIAAAQQNLQMLQQQLQQLQSLASTAQNLAKAVGQNGALSVVLPQVLSQSGLDQFNAAVSSALTGANAGSQLQSVLGQLRAQKGLPSTTASAPDFLSFSSAQQWVSNSLTTAPTANLTAQGLGRQARSMVAGEAAADGYALSLSARQQISTMSAQTQTLANQVSAAQTLRDDVAANTAIMLAVHDEMAEIQALLASLLAVQSSGQMTESDMQAAAPQTSNGASQ